MKSYKDYEKKNIGTSDIASLILVGCRKPDGLVTEILHFGEDGCYFAYVVDDDVIIGDHYGLVAEFDSWLRIYDDDGLTAAYYADQIKIYRAGEMGCIVKLCKSTKA